MNIDLKNKLYNPWIKLALACVVFVVSFVFYYYPVHVKGYPTNVGFLTLSQARNYAASGTYNYETADGVFLSSANVEQARPDGLLNPLTTMTYGLIYKYLGAGTVSLQFILLLGIAISSLVNVLMFYVASRLFHPTVGFVSALIFAFLPIRTEAAVSLVYDEIGLLLFAFTLWLYLGSDKGPFRAGNFRLVLTGVFFALTALARNAFLISFIPFVIYDLYSSRSIKRALYLVVPFVLLFVSTLTPYSWLGAPNGYLSGIDNQPSGQVGHVFGDPYSAYYDRDNVVSSIEAQEGGLGRLQTHYFKQWGYHVGFSDIIRAYFESTIFYLKESLRIITLGGPFLILLMFLGLLYLFQNKRELLQFFVVWGVVWFLGLVYFETSNRSHFLEIGLIIASLAGVGLYQLIKLLGKESHRKIAWGLLLLFLTVGHLSYSSRWKLHEAYNTSHIGDIYAYGKMLQDSELGPGRIAAGVNTGFAGAMNYFSDHDVVYFDPETIERLNTEDKLSEAFQIYNVTSVIGYSRILSDVIVSKADVEVIGIEE